VEGAAAGVDVVVATPGRAIDLMNRGALDRRELEVVVLDEADEMLDMGFVEDIETLLGRHPGHPAGGAVLRHDAAPHRGRSRGSTCASRHRADPPPGGPEGEAPQVRQTAYLVPRSHTTAALGRVLEAERRQAAIVFCRTRLDVDAVTETLTARGLRPRRCTAAWTRSTAPGSSSGCAAGAPSCWWPRTSRPAVWTSTCSRTW
jgi:ATP-dependent RNA helicase DeaD